MNLYELDRAIKYYSNQEDKASKKLVDFYKKQRPILIDRINKKLLKDNLPLIKYKLEIIK